ncbi:MAG: polymerase subunit delta [Candidatus Sumerlaeota bacterium]|nr:polymerase subunit delta [Candidatus Sumerlaeota bacterium]
MLPPSHHTFETIWGHDSIKLLVRRMLETGRLPHALLLHGPPGLGKKSLAFAIAKLIFSSGLPVRESRVEAPAPRFSLRLPEPDRAPDDDLFGGMDDLFGEQEDLFGAAEPETEPEPAAEASPPPPQPELPLEPAQPEPAQSESAQPESAQPESTKSEPVKPSPRKSKLAPPVAEPPSAAPRGPVSLDPRVDRLVSKSHPVEYDGLTPALQGFVDLSIIEPVKSKSILVEQVRDLQDLGWRAPLEGAYRVILIFGADTITLSAANSLLKLLEEPPSYLVLILVTNNAHRVLETIRSRCASLPCQPLPRGELTARLVQEEKVDAALAAVAATLSGGCPERALEVVQGGLKEQRQEVFDARLELDRRGLAALPLTTNRILSRCGSLGQASLLLMALARDRMVRSLVPGHEELLVNGDLAGLLDEMPQGAAALWEEAERLTACLQMENHPVVPSPEPALEVALWPN